MISILHADARQIPLQANIVQCVVTSPPYYGLRSYGGDPLIWDGEENCPHQWGERLSEHHPGQVKQTKWQTCNAVEQGQTAGAGAYCVRCGAWKGDLGLEPTPQMFIQHIIQVFDEVWRVLRKDGVAWLNLGDSYVGNSKCDALAAPSNKPGYIENMRPSHVGVNGLKNKDLMLIPHRTAIALQERGWWVRQDNVWAKGYSFLKDSAGTCMPESVSDRTTRSHEYMFLLSKSEKYYYDAESVREQGIFPAGTKAAKGSGTRQGNRRGTKKSTLAKKIQPSSHIARSGDFHERYYKQTDDGYAIYSGTRNLRSVWCINPKPYKEAHFATFPESLVTPCIKAGSRPGDLVLDPFGGSGTVAYVAGNLGRSCVSLDLNSAYLNLQKQRLGLLV